MKARLFVVDSQTINDVLNNNTVSVFVPNPEGKKLWVNTIIDIISDMLQMEIGDYIFLWETKSGATKNRIHGVHRVISKPFYLYIEGDTAPIKIKVEKAFDFVNPVEEYDILNDPYNKHLNWTIIGKKVAGKSRASTPITSNEMNYLISKLIEVNTSYTFKKEFDEVSIPEDGQDLVLNLNMVTTKEFNILEDFSISELGHLPSRRSKKLKYEKSLEAIFNNLFSTRNSEIISEIGIDLNNLKWYANYLPYSFEQSEIDYLVIESIDGNVESKFTVIEFMKDSSDIDHIERALLYSKWVKDNLCYGIKNIVRPLLICFSNNISEDTISSIEERYDDLHLSIYKYNIEDNKINFNLLR
jgi:hypothetical protein